MIAKELLLPPESVEGRPEGEGLASPPCSLLPCPFCGAEAKMRYYRMQATEFMQNGGIFCTKCNAVNGVQWGDIRCGTRWETCRERSAIDAWNLRENLKDQTP